MNNVLIKNLTKMYGNVKAVDNITLEIKDGEFFSLLGPSGCGKTTTLRIIAGFERADSGNILIGGNDITNSLPYKRKIGMVFQNYALWPHMTVEEHMLFGLKINKIDPVIIKKNIEETIELTDLCGLLNRYPRELSGGQQQRVALARALVLKPKVLLMDEPLSNLDKKLRVEMRIELRKLQKELGMTSIYVTHDQEEALSMSDRISIMKDGKILQTADPQNIFKNPNSSFVASFMGNENIFDCKIVRVEGDEIKLLLENEVILYTTKNIFKDRSAQEGDFVRVVIISEAIEIQKEYSEEKNVIEGRISYIDYYGYITKYLIDIKCHEKKYLNIIRNPHSMKREYNVGDKIYLKLSKDSFVIVK